MGLKIDGMQFPLKERIGKPDLFVEPTADFAEFHKWLTGIPEMLSKSRVILARKKSGKTAFIQRLFNQLWSAAGPVIPFYLEVVERKVWYPELAINYFQVFASQFISFRERDAKPVRNPLTLKDIADYGRAHGFDLLERVAEELPVFFEKGMFDSMWDLAIHAPHRMAALHDLRFVVMIDEFQNLSHYVYTDKDKTSLDETIPGSYHELSESKIAPMLATGSAVGWLIEAVDTYLEAGRLSKRWMSPYLTGEEGLEAAYRYARAYQEPVTNETALLLNKLCFSDPFFIVCVVRSNCPEKDLSTPEGVARVVDYETGNNDAELSQEWETWLNRSLDRINERHAKKILLYTTRLADEEVSPKILKQKLALDISEEEIHRKLEMLRKAELIRPARREYNYFALKDGTFYLLLKQRFKTQLAELDPEAEIGIHEEISRLKDKRNSLQGELNNLVGRFAELQLENDMRTRKRFKPSTYFQGIADDREFQVSRIYPRHVVQAPDKKGGEVDLRVDGVDDRTLIIEVKKHKDPIESKVVSTLTEHAATFAAEHPDRVVVPCILATGGFSREAIDACKAREIGMAETINYVHKSWSVAE
ncbi:MAG: hypothetical protein QNK37_12110 [Acidobacteriota bacterium]|nr:hypothetical protein [Acidobacteriota bacterium]